MTGAFQEGMDAKVNGGIFRKTEQVMLILALFAFQGFVAMGGIQRVLAALV
jgi:hypothetical protein